MLLACVDNMIAQECGPLTAPLTSLLLKLAGAAPNAGLSLAQRAGLLRLHGLLRRIALTVRGCLFLTQAPAHATPVVEAAVAGGPRGGTGDRPAAAPAHPPA